MSNAANKEGSDTRRLVEAAAWRTHLHETGAESSATFEAWLAEDARNESAWRQVQGPWEIFGQQASGSELIEARRAALGRAKVAHRWRWRDAGLLARIASIAAVVAFVTIGAVTWYVSMPDAYRTALGERRVVTLVDGSRISLDSNSDVRVKYSVDGRDVTMRQGQARFDVVRDVERPFSVTARDQKIVATGTAFNVDMMGASVLVTLIEGSVVVLDRRAQPRVLSRDALTPQTPIQPRVTELRAGEQFVLTPTERIEVKLVNLEKTTAWEEGRLVFENEPLASVVARVSRYTDRTISVTDPRAAGLRISGVFNTGDVDGFVTTITTYLPLNAEWDRNGNVVLRDRD